MPQFCLRAFAQEALAEIPLYLLKSGAGNYRLAPDPQIKIKSEAAGGIPQTGYTPTTRTGSKPPSRVSMPDHVGGSSLITNVLEGGFQRGLLPAANVAMTVPSSVWNAAAGTVRGVYGAGMQGAARLFPTGQGQKAVPGKQPNNGAGYWHDFLDLAGKQQSDLAASHFQSIPHALSSAKHNLGTMGLGLTGQISTDQAEARNIVDRQNVSPSARAHGQVAQQMYGDLAQERAKQGPSWSNWASQRAADVTDWTPVVGETAASLVVPGLPGAGYVSKGVGAASRVSPVASQAAKVVGRGFQRTKSVLDDATVRMGISPEGAAEWADDYVAPAVTGAKSFGLGRGAMGPEQIQHDTTIAIETADPQVTAQARQALAQVNDPAAISQAALNVSPDPRLREAYARERLTALKATPVQTAAAIQDMRARAEGSSFDPMRKLDFAGRDPKNFFEGMDPKELPAAVATFEQHADRFSAFALESANAIKAAGGNPLESPEIVEANKSAASLAALVVSAKHTGGNVEALVNSGNPQAAPGQAAPDPATQERIKADAARKLVDKGDAPDETSAWSMLGNMKPEEQMMIAGGLGIGGLGLLSMLGGEGGILGLLMSIFGIGMAMYGGVQGGMFNSSMLPKGLQDTAADAYLAANPDLNRQLDQHAQSYNRYRAVSEYIPNALENWWAGDGFLSEPDPVSRAMKRRISQTRLPTGVTPETVETQVLRRAEQLRMKTSMTTAMSLADFGNLVKDAASLRLKGLTPAVTTHPGISWDHLVKKTPKPVVGHSMTRAMSGNSIDAVAAGMSRSVSPPLPASEALKRLSGPARTLLGLGAVTAVPAAVAGGSYLGESQAISDSAKPAPNSGAQTAADLSAGYHRPSNLRSQNTGLSAQPNPFSPLGNTVAPPEGPPMAVTSGGRNKVAPQAPKPVAPPYKPPVFDAPVAQTPTNPNNVSPSARVSTGGKVVEPVGKPPAPGAPAAPGAAGAPKVEKGFDFSSIFKMLPEWLQKWAGENQMLAGMTIAGVPLLLMMLMSKSGSVEEIIPVDTFGQYGKRNGHFYAY